MRLYYSLVLVVLILIVTSCIEIAGPSDNDNDNDIVDNFSLRIKLTDSSGTPLKGYKIIIFQRDMPYGPYMTGKSSDKAATTYMFSASENYQLAEIKIYNYFDQPIRTLLSNPIESGQYNIIWNGKDNNGNLVRDGIYKAVLKYYIGSEAVFSQIRYAYLLAELDWTVHPKITNAQGIYSDSEILPYPDFYFYEILYVMDSQGLCIGEWMFSSNMRIIIKDEQGIMKYHDFQIYNRANNINLNWDTMHQIGFDLGGDDFIGYSTNSYSNPKDDPLFELTSFTAAETYYKLVRLEWVTAYETYLLGFNINRGVNDILSESEIINQHIIPASNTSSTYEYYYVDTDVVVDQIYYYWLRVLDLDLREFVFGPISITLEDPPDPPDPPDPELINSLHQNYPNPFN